MAYYIRKPKKKSPSMSSLVKRLDKEFSRYIRLRDAMPSGTFRCISCGQIKPLEQADCGHYHSRTHMATRFDEDNCHAECRYCNRFKADHMIGYRENLLRKIGEKRFTLLEVKAHGIRKWSHFELEVLISDYKKRADNLAKEKGLKL